MLKTNNRAYWQYVLDSSKWMHEEAEKRLKFTPFDHTTFAWYLIHEKGPLFFVLRDMLRRGGYKFAVIDNPGDVAHLEDLAILTPWAQTCGRDPIKIRGEHYPLSELPLYYESGDWGCPQQNFLFDWTEDQATMYLIEKDIMHWEDIT